MTSVTRYSAVFLFLLSLLLAAGNYLLSSSAVHKAAANAASAVQLCQAGNESRAQQITLWTHLVAISAPPPHETPAQKRKGEAATAQFLAYLRTVFAPRNCAASFKG